MYMSSALLRSAANRLACAAAEAPHVALALARDRSGSCSTSGRHDLHVCRRLQASRQQRLAVQAAPAQASATAEVDEDDWWDEAQPVAAPQGGAAPQAAPLTEVELPPPTATRVKTAEYKSSAVRLDQCPPATLPEFAVIGRSNVGQCGPTS